MIVTIILNILAFLLVIGFGILLAKSDLIREFFAFIFVFCSCVILPYIMIKNMISGNIGVVIVCIPTQILLGVISYVFVKYLIDYRKNNKYRLWKKL